MTRDQIGPLLDSLPPAEVSAGDSGYALPDATLRLLTRIIGQCGVRNVFEFGSGRSTRTFLAAGCEVTAVEDSQSWLDETLATLAPEERARLHAVCQPLTVLTLQHAPMRSWKLDSDTLQRLAAADLVLIDAPAFPPFREHALAISLEHCRRALIIVDDARIPTVRRFCARLAAGAPHWERHIDHGLFFILREATAQPPPRPLLETAKAWRRFFMAPR